MWEIDDASGGQCIATMCGHTGPVTGAAELAPSRIVSVSLDKTMKVWKIVELPKGGVGIFFFFYNFLSFLSFPFSQEFAFIFAFFFQSLISDQNKIK